MSSQIFIMLLNPGIGLLLAATFYLLWSYQRSQRYILLAAAGYVLNALAFLIQDVLPTLPFHIDRILSNAFFLGSAWVLAAAILQRFHVRPPHLIFGLLTGVALTAVVWFLYVSPNMTARILFASSAIGGIALVLSASLWPAPKKHLIDKLLFWFGLLAAANFILRPLAILWLAGSFGGEAGFRSSLYWTTVQFGQALISIMIALNLMVAVAIDLLADLKHEAFGDKLSGLLNRRGFESRASAALADCHRRGLPASFLIADLDHFKQVNDTYGHAAGDRVITLFGELFNVVRSPDMIAGRIGGEEFAVLLPGIDLAAGKLFADSLRAGLCAAAAGRLPQGLRPTVSIGLCNASPGMDLYAVLAEADGALYQAKKSGRDRVQVAVPGLHAASAAFLLKA